MNFWENLLRYPRFFISSMIGLLLILVNPIFQVFKNFKNREIIFIFIFSFLTILFWLLKTMLTID